MSSNDLDWLVNNLPEMQRAPQLALAAANAPDSRSSGQVLAHTANTYANDQAVQQIGRKVGHPNLLHQTLGFFGGTISKVSHEVNQATGGVAGDVLGGAAHIANMGLQEVQHQYRALHDIEARHGPVVGLLEALGVVAAGAAAVVAAPVTGGGSLAAFGAGTAAILGAEAATGVVERVAFKDSWDRTEHGEAYQGVYNRNTGEYSGGPVSFGRDLADHLPHPLRFMSGITDGLFDLTLDPTIVAGKAFSAARAARLSIPTVEAFDRAVTSPLTAGSVNRAFDWMAAESSGQKIALRYPKFEGISQDLAKLGSRDEIATFFRDNLAVAEFLARTPGSLPNLPMTRVPFAAMRDLVNEYGGPGSARLSVFQKLGTSLDEDTLKLSNRQFDPSGNTWRTGVYHVLRYGQNDQVARGVVDAMSATDHLGMRRDIYINAIHNMLYDGLGLSEDNRFASQIMQKLEDTTSHLGGPQQIYSGTADGRNLSILPATENTTSRAAAVFENQTGKWSFPDFREVHRAKAAQHAITNMLGAADDAFYDHFTSAIFKRGALLTGGFALRIAAAETIPAIFRTGLGTLVRDSVNLHLGAKDAAYDRAVAELEAAHKAAFTAESGADAAARIAWAAEKVNESETGNIVAAVHRLSGGLTKASTRRQAEDIDLFARHVVSQDGHMVPSALNAAHHDANYLDGAVDAKTGLLHRIFNKTPPALRHGDTFGFVGVGSEHTGAWRAALHEAGNDEMGRTAARTLHESLAAGASIDEATRRATEAVRAVLGTKDAKWLGRFERNFTSSTELAPLDDWAKVVVDSVKGVTGHPYDADVIHRDVLAHLAEGKVAPDGILEGISPAERPLVKGRDIAPHVPEGALATIANGGFHQLGKIINFLSREPMFGGELSRQYAPLRHLVEQELISPDEALRVAQIRAVNAMTPFIHNPLERSQFAHLSRNFMPFYFAQTQSYRRVGRLLADNPGAFRQYQLSTAALHDVTHVVDENGQAHLVLPGAGFLGTTAAAAFGLLGADVIGSVPVAFTGNVQSLNTVFPFAEEPGGIGVGPVAARFGPLVSIPLHVAETLFPEVGIPLASKILGPVGASGGIIDQFVPNAPLRNLLKAQGLLPGGAKDLANAMVQTMQTLSTQQEHALRVWNEGGQKGPRPDVVPGPDAAPDVRQKFVDRVRNQSRILLYTKAIISAVSPVSPRLEIGDLQLTDELRTLIASKGPDGRPLGLGGGITEFLARHPDATPYTVFGSKTTTGAVLPANQPAQDFINANQSLMHKYPAAAAWLIPQTDDPYSQTVYNEQLATGLREKKAPAEVLRDIYIAQGNSQFYDRDLPVYRKALGDAEGDPARQKEIRASFNTYLSKELGAQNPVWWDEFQSKDREHNRTRALGQLSAMFAAGEAPVGPQTDGVRGLLDDYAVYQAAVTSGRQDGWAADERDAMKNKWQAYLDQLAVDRPELSPVISRLFRSV